MKPKHKVVTRSPHRVVGLVACTWLQAEPIEYESQLERRFIQRALLTPGVKRIQHQPFQIPYGNNLENTYTPDFLLLFDDGKKIVVEVKPQKFVKKFSVMFDEIDQILNSKYFDFHVVTDCQIDVGNEPEDIELLLRYGRGNFSKTEINSLLSYLANHHENIEIGKLSQLASVNIQLIFHLIARRVLSFSYCISTASNTLIRLTEKENHDQICIPSWIDATKWITNAGICEAAGQERSPVRRSHNAPRLCMGDK